MGKPAQELFLTMLKGRNMNGLERLSLLDSPLLLQHGRNQVAENLSGVASHLPR